MAKGQHLSAYQQKIVRRFYEHRGTILVGKLAELVSEIYLASSDKVATRHWKAAGEWMVKAGVDPADAREVVENRRIEDLAAIVTALNAAT